MNIGRCTGLVSTVMTVLFSISTDTAPEAEKIAMNKLVRKSVDRPISRRSLLSSSIVYIDNDGLTRKSNRAIKMMTAYTGCRNVSTRVFFAMLVKLCII